MDRILKTVAFFMQNWTFGRAGNVRALWYIFDTFDTFLNFLILFGSTTLPRLCPISTNSQNFELFLENFSKEKPHGLCHGLRAGKNVFSAKTSLREFLQRFRKFRGGCAGSGEKEQGERHAPSFLKPGKWGGMEILRSGWDTDEMFSQNDGFKNSAHTGNTIPGTSAPSKKTYQYGLKMGPQKASECA